MWVVLRVQVIGAETHTMAAFRVEACRQVPLRAVAGLSS